MPASIVNQVVNLHRAQLQGIVELGGVRKVRKLYEQARAELEERLAALKRRGMGESFTAFHMRQILLQVRDGLLMFQDQFGPALSKNAKAGALLAQRHTIGAITQFERRFTGTRPVLAIEEAGVFARSYRGLEPSLLSRYHKYVRNYPQATINRIQNGLALSLIQGEPLERAVDKVAATDGLFARDRWRAERIARTEMGYAYGITGQKMLEETAHEVPGLMKRLVATIDARTGDDSKILDGQTVPWNKPFVWMKPTKAGPVRVEYMAPPNRPNDREVMVPWRADYHSRSISSAPITPRLPSGIGI